jgi:hypothetical protein
VGCIFCYFNASIFKGRRKKQDSLVRERKQKEKSAWFSQRVKNFSSYNKNKNKLQKKKMKNHIPVTVVSLHERQALSCFAAFFTLSPFTFKNRFTQP